MSSVTQAESVALARMEHWLEAWGQVKACRLDGGVLPEKEPVDGSRRAAGIANVAAAMIDVDKQLGSAPPVVRYLLYAMYADGRISADVQTLVSEFFGGKLRPHTLRGVSQAAAAELLKWKLTSARRLRL